MLKKRAHPGKSNASTNPNRLAPGKDSGDGKHFRTKAKMRLLNLYNEKPDEKERHKQKIGPARIEPDRKWYGNVRTIDQKNLEKFRVELAQHSNDPYQVLLNAKKLPLSLIKEPTKKAKVNILDFEKYEETFGPKSRRTRAKMTEFTIEGLAKIAEDQGDTYDVSKDSNLQKDETNLLKSENKDKRIEAGQSRRIWEELYKVVDSSDVVVMVLDARNPEGTRSKHIENHQKHNCPYKHPVFVLNKCDLVPTSVTKAWVAHLSQDYPTIAFRAHLDKAHGRFALLQQFRQYDNFHKDKKTVSVGFIGYPNVGKSSVINTMKDQKVCVSAPIPGETKVWQYVALTKRLYLIDCPGVVYNREADDDTDIVMKGVVRAERQIDADFYIQPILDKANRKDMENKYKVKGWKNSEEFLTLVARHQGKLLKGGEPDIMTTAKSIIYDWQKGNIPYYYLPPGMTEEDVNKKEVVIEEKIDIPDLIEEDEE